MSDFGPISITRNLLYAFSFVGLLGVGLTIVLGVGLVLSFRRVVAGEEALPAEQQGAAFEAYRQRVPR